MLGLLALVVLIAPDTSFSMVSAEAWEIQVLRAVALAGVTLWAAFPWVARASPPDRIRFRRWLVPGVAATVVYVVGTDPFFLLIGFSLLAGAAMDVWVTRAHLASDSLRVRLDSRDRRHID